MFRRTAFLLVIGVFIFSPFSASAATVNFFGPIVDERCRCDAETTGITTEINGETVGIDSAPDWPCVLVTIQNAVAVGISFVFLMITLIIAYSGLMIIVQPDNVRHREAGKQMLTNAILGLVIVLTAWLIVDFVMKAFYNQSKGAEILGKAPTLAWNSIFSDDLDQSKLCFVPRVQETEDDDQLNEPDTTTPDTTTAPPPSSDPVPAPPAPVTTTATPVAPSNFFVTGEGISYIELSWAPAVTGVERYQLDYTSTTKPGAQTGSVVADDSTYKHLQSFGASAPGYFVHMGLQPNTRYFYRLWAINGVNEENLSDRTNWKYAKSVTTGITKTQTSTAPPAPTKVEVPGTPTGLTATAVGTTQVNVSWTATPGATEYQLDLATGSAGAYAKVYAGSAKTYTYAVKTPGTTHHFALWAKNSSGFSKKAAIVSVAVGGGTSSCPEPSVDSGTAVVSSNAISALKSMLKTACLSSAEITSGSRTPADQARIMYDNIVSLGVSNAYATYGSNGDKVIAVYETEKAAGKNATQIKAAMEAKINELGPYNVSKHMHTGYDTFDVAPSSITNRSKFEAALKEAQDTGLISNYLLPGQGEPAYHIEIELEK